MRHPASVAGRRSGWREASGFMALSIQHTP
jgi:hypothetical protein